MDGDSGGGKSEGEAEHPSNPVEDGQEEGAGRAAGPADDDESELIDPREWVRDAMRQGLSARQILEPLLGDDCPPMLEVDDATLWRLLLTLLMVPDPRNKLPQYNTVDQAVKLISDARNIVVLTGAGISVSCGIPDFRSPQGLYATLHREFPELPDPQAMFDIQYFRDDPRPFFRFCKEIYPGQFTPSPSHFFIAALEKRGKLLRHYTQNIDTLEQTAGISRVVYCHGSFATASCCRCKYRVNCDAIREDIMKQKVPVCPKCEEEESKSPAESDENEEEEILGVMKPDIVFFGEGLPDEFHHALEEDKAQVDLLIVMGSSLKVKPVALIPSVLDQSVPQLLINREPLPHMTFDIQLLGYSDTIIKELCHRLGEEWVKSVGGATDKENVSYTSPKEHVHLFPGAVWKPSSNDNSPVADSDNGQIVRASESESEDLNTTSEPSHKMTHELSGTSSSEPVPEPASALSRNNSSVHSQSSSLLCSAITASPTNDNLDQPLSESPPTKRLKADPTVTDSL